MRANPLFQFLALLFGLSLFGLLCAVWLPIALLLERSSANPWRNRVGRLAVRRGFDLYLGILEFLGLLELDLDQFNLNDLKGPVLLAPNHPSLLDAIIILSRCPHIGCVLKSDLLAHPLLGPGARLAGYISNRHPRQMIHDVEREIKAGHTVLLFPEGTRSRGGRISTLKLSPALIARRLGCEIQTVLIESSSGFLGKGWPWYRPPALPVRITLRLGACFPAASDVRELTRGLQTYYYRELIERPSESTP